MKLDRHTNKKEEEEEEKKKIKHRAATTSKAVRSNNRNRDGSCRNFPYEKKIFRRIF